MKKKYLFLILLSSLLFSSCGIKYVDSIVSKDEDWGTEYLIYDFSNNIVYNLMTPAPGNKEKPVLFTYKLVDMKRELISEEKKDYGKIEYEEGKIKSIVIGNKKYIAQ